MALAHDDAAALPGLNRLAGLVRTVRTPDFAGITFHEVHCRSGLNRVPSTSPMPFGWTVNPYRGCSHACVYCFARNTHTYLEFDSGADFDSEIVVKTNIGAVVAREVQSPRWAREHVAMGTNTDPYQRAEGRYQLMPEIIRALAGSGTPFSILTKGTVLARDLPVLAAARTDVPIGMGVSLALLDPALQAVLEPGTPTPRARLELIRRIRDAGLPCGVLIAPVLPHLTDSAEQLDAVVAEVVEAGATGISCVPLHLRPGAREWFLRWLGQHHPELTETYLRLYAHGSTLPRPYRERLQATVRELARSHGLASGTDQLRGLPGDETAGFPAGSMPDLPARPAEEPATLF
nr:Rv2578c family radical SAM protein [Nakamurella flavida]